MPGNIKAKLLPSQDFEKLNAVSELLTQYYTLQAPQGSSNAYSYSTLELASLSPEVRAQALYSDALGLKQIAELRRSYQGLPLNEIKNTPQIIVGKGAQERKEVIGQTTSKVKAGVIIPKSNEKFLCTNYHAKINPEGTPYSCQKIPKGEDPVTIGCISGKLCGGQYCCGTSKDIYCCPKNEEVPKPEEIPLISGETKALNVREVKTSKDLIINGQGLVNLRLQYRSDGNWYFCTTNRLNNNCNEPPKEITKSHPPESLDIGTDSEFYHTILDINDLDYESGLNQIVASFLFFRLRDGDLLLRDRVWEIENDDSSKTEISFEVGETLVGTVDIVVGDKRFNNVVVIKSQAELKNLPPHNEFGVGQSISKVLGVEERENYKKALDEIIKQSVRFYK